jgi:DNA gyrase subunit B
MMADTNDYDCHNIVVLEGLEPVRKRPGMYIGDTSNGSGLHHMLWEVVANSLDEHLAGRADHIRVSVEGSLAEVEDNGRGIPVERTARGVSVIEAILTQLHGGATRDGHWPHVHVSPGGFGVGLAVVNGLSEELEVEVRRDGYVWLQRYARGKPLGPLTRGARTERSGTRLRFRADRTIFSGPHFDRAIIRERLEELSLWNSELTLELMGERIHAPEGTARWIDKLALDNGCGEFGEVFTTRATRDSVFVEVALAWSGEPQWELRSFVGQSRTHQGGSHEKGFWSGLTSAVLAQQSNGKVAIARPRRARHCLAPGLLAVVHVALKQPEFAGPTRDRLDSPPAERAVHRHLSEVFGAYLAERPELARSLLERLESAVR